MLPQVTVRLTGRAPVISTGRAQAPCPHREERQPARQQPRQAGQRTTRRTAQITAAVQVRRQPIPVRQQPPPTTVR